MEIAETPDISLFCQELLPRAQLTKFPRCLWDNAL